MGIKKGVIVGIIGGILTVLGVILPWAASEFGSVSGLYTIPGTAIGTTIFGYPLLILGILGLLMALPGKKGLAMGTIIMGIIAMLLGLIVIGFVGLISDISGGVASMGIGAILCLVGPIVMILGGFMIRSDVKKEMMAPPAPPAAPPA